MASPLLTTAASLNCPHGGSVAISSMNSRVSAGPPLALASDMFSIAGCPFQIPVGTGSVPHPCVTVQWIRPNTRVTVGGTPTLAMDSSGLCMAADQLPQGNVIIAATQMRASGS
jgi:hypothetical protein